MFKETKVQMDKSVQRLSEQFTAIRSGAITPGVIDSVRVNYHGQQIDIAHLATTSRDQGRIAVHPYDPGCLHEIDAALKKEGFNSHIFSKTTLVVQTGAIQTTAEREKVLNRISKLAEEAKIAIRNIRRKARQSLSNDASLSINELKKGDKQLQDLTDASIASVDKLVKEKVGSL